MAGVIDYTLAKRALLRSFRRGTVGRVDVCDAQRELTRAAANVGSPAGRPCPMCSGPSLKEVCFVYGDALGRASGRVVHREDWLEELEERHDEFRCYQVEVCLDCAWNHVCSSRLAGRRHRPREQAAQGGSPSAD